MIVGEAIPIANEPGEQFGYRLALLTGNNLTIHIFRSIIQSNSLTECTV